MTELSRIEVPTGMDAPDLPNDHRLRAIIATSLKRRGAALDAEAPADPVVYWPASHFGLDRVERFRAADATTKFKILSACSDSLLREAFFIEKGGMHYTAKISLLARTTEERLLYNLFSSEEAQHFHWVSSFVRASLRTDPEASPFLSLLNRIAQFEDRETLIFVLQVVLEGWGLHHYKALAADCLHPELKAAFERILRDEAGHHGGGLVLFNESECSPEKVAKLIGLMRLFLPMVQIGPQAVAGILFTHTGPAALEERVKAFNELECEAKTGRKLGILEDCVRSARHGPEIADILKAEGYFQAFTSEICASAGLNG